MDATDRFRKGSCDRSGCQGEEEARRRGNREKHIPSQSSRGAAAAGTSLPAVISYRGEGESGRGVRRYERLIPSSSSSSSSFISSAAVPAYIVRRCSSLVAIFHGDCICDLCVNRNESAERFPLAFDSPPHSSCVCRYHTRSHACIDTNSKPAFRYYVHIGFFTSFFLHKCKSSTDHTHTHTLVLAPQVWVAQRWTTRRPRSVVIHVRSCWCCSLRSTACGSSPATCWKTWRES